MKKRNLKIVSTFVCLAVTIAAAAIFVLGSELSAPANHEIGPAPTDLAAVNVEFNGVKGWYVPSPNSTRCVVLMHGVRSDRRSMIDRASFLKGAGYSSLLFDFQAHGESAGNHITFGYLESVNARDAVQLLRSRFQCRQVAAIGQSLGGAAALLGEQPLDVDAAILESVYPTIEEAVSDRLRIRFGGIGAQFSSLLTMQLKPRIGVDASALRPIEGIAKFIRPIFVIAGTADEHTRIAESQRLFAAANAPKEFWAVEGAAHVDLYQYSPDVYRRRVLAFLGTYLADDNDSPTSLH